MNAPLRRGTYLALVALLTSSGTLVCCVLPVLMVAMGAGAALASLVSAVPQLVWLSEHKPLVFGTAAAALVIAGAAIRRSRMVPCPIQPDAARACRTLRRWSAALYGLAVLAFVLGAAFAFVLPAFAVDSADRRAEVRERGADAMIIGCHVALSRTDKGRSFQASRQPIIFR
ncbi:MAG TPA: hypothetical protein VFB32_17750 [Rudaea sp.]|nr:hypothetical protein [Rudaea sp.]